MLTICISSAQLVHTSRDPMLDNVILEPMRCEEVMKKEPSQSGPALGMDGAQEPTGTNALAISMETGSLSSSQCGKWWFTG